MRIIKTIAAVFATTAVLFAADSAKVTNIPILDIDGKPTSLDAYKGKVILAVNVASKCGLTPQYTALEATYQKYKDKGLVIVGFPCNDFGSQEPGTAEEIKSFCSTKYNVSFPLMGKLHVKGPEQHPLYKGLTGPGSKFPGDIKWNFGKFLIGRNGEVLERFEPKTTPDSAEVTKAIEAALKTK